MTRSELTRWWHPAIITVLLLAVGGVDHWLDMRLSKVPTLAELSAIPPR